MHRLIICIIIFISFHSSAIAADLPVIDRRFCQDVQPVMAELQTKSPSSAMQVRTMCPQVIKTGQPMSMPLNMLDDLCDITGTAVNMAIDYCHEDDALDKDSEDTNNHKNPTPPS